jgi:hypothetical protein
MTTVTLSKLSAAIEVVTGILLITSPSLVVRILLSAHLSDAGVAVGRLCGIALLSLGLACWPNENVTSAQATRALFTYNLLAAFYLGYLRVGAGFVSYLLWPACVLHALLAAWLARPVYTIGRHR